MNMVGVLVQVKLQACYNKWLAVEKALPVYDQIRCAFVGVVLLFYCSSWSRVHTQPVLLPAIRSLETRTPVRPSRQTSQWLGTHKLALLRRAQHVCASVI